MADLAPDAGFRKNRKLKDALLRHKALSKEGFSERLFGLLFSGLVYPQIWEDPDVDMQAMELQPNHRIVTIGSGGCNMLAYLSQSPASIDVVDLNPHHIALNRLKLAAFRHLPDHAELVRFFGTPNARSNSRAFDQYLAPALDNATRTYWNSRTLARRRRVTVFDRNIYETGLLGRFIGAAHLMARLHGVNLREMAQTRSIREQRQFFDDKIAPLFEKPLVRWITDRKSSLFGLGIPPQQYDELKRDLNEGKTVIDIYRERARRLACDYPIDENYFAWQAFDRRYDTENRKAVPEYLKEENYDRLRGEVHKLTADIIPITSELMNKPKSSFNRFVFLDAQDWMDSAAMTDLWSAIASKAEPGARIIFRTAGSRSPLEANLPEAVLGRFNYEGDRSLELFAQDRSSIYGGFHLYVFNA